MSDKLAVTFADIKAAQKRIEGGIVKTPQQYSAGLSHRTGAEVYLKFETFQFTSSFKDRGALNKLLMLTDGEKRRGVIANSAGNHAQGIAYHATRLGIPSTIVMPEGTPFNKVKRTEDLGATVILAGKNFSEARIEAERLRDEQNLVFVSPFDDEYIIAGQGTMALELLEAFPDLDAIIVPIGGGGMIAGIAVAAKAINPDIKIYGVQSEVYPSMVEALKGNSINPKDQTIAEGIAVKEPGKLTLPIVKALVEGIFTVSEGLIERAINRLVEDTKVVVEGAGAASLAALQDNSALFQGKKVALILAGGNIDPRILASSLMRALVRDGRISRLKITTPDSPGSLAKLTDIVARQGGNVMEVFHQRQFAAIPLKYTTIELVVETKDAAHRDRIVAALEAAEFSVVSKTVKEG